MVSLATVLFHAALAAGCTLPANDSKGAANGNGNGSNGGGGATAGSDSGSTASPGVTGIADECVNGGPSTAVDGWSRAIRADDLEMQKGAMRVELHYSIEMTDALRAGGGDVSGNVWDFLLGSRFRVKSRTIANGTANEQFAYGDAVDLATNAPVFIGVAPVVSSGVARPVIVIAPSRMEFDANFPSVASVVDMHRYNALPLSCTGLDGGWTSSFSSAAATYGASGAFTGISVSSLSVDLAFADASAYTLHTKAFANGEGETRDDAGQYTAQDYGLTLTGQSGATEYDAAFVAVKGGLALFMQNRQLAGDRYVLFRAK